jgi:hypothetical protein
VAARSGLRTRAARISGRHPPASGEMPRFPFMKICIVSDSHDNAPMLLAAVRAARAAGAETVLHCGDVIGSHTIRPLIKLGLPVHVVHGNNLGDPDAMHRLAARSNGLVFYHGPDAQLTLANRRVFLVHYPHYGHAMACTGEWDLVCCGHSHEARIARWPHAGRSETWLVNPGTVAGLAAPATYALGELAEMRFEILEVPPMTPENTPI